MATSVLAFTVTVPAGTLSSSLYVQSLAVGTNTIDLIHWRVPPGPRGNLGWFLSMGRVQVVPEIAGSYVVADDESDDWQISDLPDSGAWQLSGYNTGQYNHTVYLYFHVTPVQLSSPAPGDILTGFPSADQQIPTTWVT